MGCTVIVVVKVETKTLCAQLLLLWCTHLWALMCVLLWALMCVLLWVTDVSPGVGVDRYDAVYHPKP